MHKSSCLKEKDMQYTCLEEIFILNYSSYHVTSFLSRVRLNIYDIIGQCYIITNLVCSVLVSHGQTTKFLQGVIACSISTLAVYHKCLSCRASSCYLMLARCYKGLVTVLQSAWALIPPHSHSLCLSWITSIIYMLWYWVKALQMPEMVKQEALLCALKYRRYYMPNICYGKQSYGGQITGSCYCKSKFVTSKTFSYRNYKAKNILYMWPYAQSNVSRSDFHG